MKPGSSRTSIRHRAGLVTWRRTARLRTRGTAMFRRGRALRSGRSRYSAEGDPGASGHPSSPEPAPDLGLEHRGEGWLRFARQGPFGPRVLDGLGQAAADAGPLPEKTRYLVQLAAAAAIRSEGAVHSHARRALAAGAT